MGNEFYQELKRPRRDLHRSFVDFRGQDAKSAVERFYAQSEQRPGKLFFPGGDRALLVTAHPDWDQAWFDNLDDATVTNLAETEEVKLLETRVYRWFCGCSHARVLEMLAPVFKQSPDELFGPDETVHLGCPRCAAGYGVTREALEAHLADVQANQL